MPSPDLKKILDNKTLGSSELTEMLNDYFLSIKENNSKIKKSILQVKEKLGHFENVNSYLSDLNATLKKNDQKELNRFLKNYSDNEQDKIQLIFDRLYPEVNKMKSVITLSRSGTVIGVLKLWCKKNKKLNVVVCESRPELEGRSTAMELIKAEIKVELITDAMMGIYIQKVDCALIGADSILKNGNVVNKVGSRALALLSENAGKPFYVVSAKSKLSKNNTCRNKEENPDEIWKNKIKNLQIRNIYFEVIEKKLITKVFTD